MKTKIYEQATAYIESMAKSLGVAAEHVYGILVKQQVAEGITAIAVSILIIAILTIALTVVIRMWRNYDGLDSEGYVIATCVIGFFLLLAIIFGLAEGSEGVMKIMNPEYYAIKEIMEVIKGAAD